MKKKITAITIVLIFIIAFAALSVLMILQTSGGSSKVDSKISKKEISGIEEKKILEEEQEYNAEYGMTLVPIDEKITITPTGISSESAGESKAPAETATSGGDYIISDSNTRILEAKDVENLSATDLKFARNEIIARHGRIFEDAELSEYFKGKSWYKGTIEPAEFDQSYEQNLSETEKANVELIKTYEKGGQ